MADIKQELRYYQPIDVEKLSGDKAAIPDNIRNSIILYNKAIESMNMHSEDIATIELKKAIAMNPSFYEAINLLGICYYQTGNYEKAQQMFERVALAEANGINAYRYIGILADSVGLARHFKHGGISFPVMTAGAEANSKDTGKGTRVSSKGIMQKNTAGKKMNTIRYIAGFLAGVFLFAIFILAGGIEKGTAELTGLSEEVEQLKSDNETLKVQYDSLDKEYDLQKALLQTVNSDLDYYILTNKLFEVYMLYTQKDYEGAAEIILLIKDMALKEPAASFSQKIISVILPLAAESAYEKGRVLYGEGKYSDALIRLEKVGLYYMEFPQMDAVYYNVGKCYRELKDSTKAIAAFQHIIDNYPKSLYASYSVKRIRELGGA